MKSALVSKRIGAWAALPLMTLATHAQATNLFDPSVSAAAGINNSTVQLDGTIFSFGPSAAVWTVDVFAGVGECMRLDVSAQPADLEIVVVAPNGTVFRNDDRAAGDVRPLVKIASTPNNGWYTVHVARFNGAPVEGNFTILYGRYITGNANCAAPTAPTLTSQSPAADLLEEEAATTLKDQAPDETNTAAPKPNSPGSR